MNTIQIGTPDLNVVTVGADCGMVLVAGPCVIESEDLCLQIAEVLKDITDRLKIGYVFKASFDKANRTSLDSFRGPGLDEGLAILANIRRKVGVPVACDIHLPAQAEIAAQTLDLLQIPAFLARQTDLVVAAAKTKKPLQVKKAQFMAPWDMKNVVEKIKKSGNENIILVERGSSFGYNRLVCDMCSIPHMQQLGCPVFIDATHSTQQPSGLGGLSGGSGELAEVLARAAIAAGANGLFIETHPKPKEALSDAACMIPLEKMETLLTCCRDIFERLRRL